MAFNYTKGYDNYAKFPMHYLRITQSYKQGNHIDHWNGANYKDYPIDLGGIDSGRDYLYAPVDMKIVALKGIGNTNVSNKIFLESTKAVKTPSHGTTKIFMTAVHFEDSDVNKFGLKVGKIIREGKPICLEGRETATANHLHLTCGIGSATTSIQNNKGKWVTKGNCKKPEEIFYIDNNFTVIKNMAGLSFKNLPKKVVLKQIGNPIERNITKNQIEVIVDELSVREIATTTGKILGYANRGIYNYSEIKEADNYNWYNIGIGWIAFNDKWCKLYPKEEINEKLADSKEETPSSSKTTNEIIKNEPTVTNNVITTNDELATNSSNNSLIKIITSNIFTKIVSFFKKIINIFKKK